MSKRLLSTYLNGTDNAGSLDLSGSLDVSGRVIVSTRSVGRPFRASDIRTIYRYPPVPTSNVVVGVISLGGTLTGNIDINGMLTNGDVQAYWRSLGMTSLPAVKVVRINGSVLDPSDSISTIENTIDVQMVGACCPTSRLTIILYYYNQYTTNNDAFYGTFSYAINTPVSIPGLGMVKPSIISCSWGASENLFTAIDLNKYNTLFAVAASSGITITTAAGDHGSSNGTTGTVTDFPTSSPNVVSCGGTNLVCPNQDASGNYIYTGATETTWSWSNVVRDGTGGGVSSFFNGPPFPRDSSQKRQVPDLSLVADPETGVQFLINGISQIIGGTSIVSPAIAGLAACLPRAPKGLLSKLYALPSSAFYDITVGNNGAYNAGPGFDNCTGLGSVNGANFVPAYTALITSPVTSARITGTVTAIVGATSQLTSSPSWWFSSNPAVATVTNGLVRGIAAGSTNISVTTKDGFFTTSTPFAVTTVIPPSLRISTTPGGPAITNIILRRNASITLHTVPTNILGPVTWTTSNVNLAIVDPNGHIALDKSAIVRIRNRIGSVLITAICGALSASVVISVR